MKYNNFLRAWIRVDSKGVMIPGTFQLRPYSVKRPLNGNWVELQQNTCCGSDCIITFRVSGTATDITSIVSSDGSVNWTGTIDNNGYKSFVIPNCYDMSYTVTMTAPSGTVTVAAVTTQGTGVVSATPTSIPSGASPVTTVVSTTATGNSEYLVTISG